MTSLLLQSFPVSADANATNAVQKHLCIASTHTHTTLGTRTMKDMPPIGCVLQAEQTLLVMLSKTRRNKAIENTPINIVTTLVTTTETVLTNHICALSPPESTNQSTRILMSFQKHKSSVTCYLDVTDTCHFLRHTLSSEFHYVSLSLIFCVITVRGASVILSIIGY